MSFLTGFFGEGIYSLPDQQQNNINQTQQYNNYLNQYQQNQAYQSGMQNAYNQLGQQYNQNTYYPWPQNPPDPKIQTAKDIVFQSMRIGIRWIEAENNIFEDEHSTKMYESFFKLEDDEEFQKKRLIFILKQK